MREGGREGERKRKEGDGGRRREEGRRWVKSKGREGRDKVGRQEEEGGSE